MLQVYHKSIALLNVPILFTDPPCERDESVRWGPVSVPRGRGPAGRLPVTKEMGVISVTPLSGYGLALLDRLPVKPDHKPCAVPRRVAGGFSYGMSSEYMDQDVTFGFVGSVSLNQFITTKETASPRTPVSGCGLAPPLLGYLPYPSAIPCVVPRSVVRGFVAEWSTEVGLGRNIGSDTGSSGYHDAGNVGRVNFSIP